MTKFFDHWETKLTVALLFVAGIFEAVDQGLKSSASLAALAPSLSESALFHFAPLILLIAAGVLWITRGRKIAEAIPAPTQLQQATNQLTTNPVVPAPASPIDVKAFFLHGYAGQLQAETEKNVRAMIQSQPAHERDDFIVRFIATGIVSVMHEEIWNTIYKSQILALQDMNRKNIVVRREELEVFYDVAALEYSEEYATRPIARWRGYMEGMGLILPHPGDTFEITVRGKDFLKYMVHCSYTADDRKY